MLERIQQSVSAIQKTHALRPDIGIVLGSGLGKFVEQIQSPTTIPYSEIPGFHECTVEGHNGALHLGKIGGKNVAVMQGRFHFYEGLQLNDVILPVRVLGKLGVKNLILTNAAGGMNTAFNQGQLVLIKDHINMTGQNPLIGPNIPQLGPRFPDMTHTYCKKSMEYFEQQANELNIDLKTGVYAGVLGPTYETPAEVKMLQKLGADLVGMSTVPEAIAARHMGLNITGISCVTNLAAGISKIELKHEDIKEVADRVMGDFTKLLVETIEKKFPL